MIAKIYLPAKTATQSGIGNTRLWLLEFDKDKTNYKSILMGWNGSKDTNKQVRLLFNSCDEAVNYAKQNNLSYQIILPATKTIKKKSYAANFIKKH